MFINNNGVRTQANNLETPKNISLFPDKARNASWLDISRIHTVKIIDTIENGIPMNSTEINMIYIIL